MELKQIKETCIYIKDLEVARHFYHEILGLAIISYVKEKHIFFRVGKSVLLCFNPDDSSQKKSPPPHYTSGKYHFAFEVSKTEYGEIKRQLMGKGIAITAEISWKNGLKSVYFEDPAGNVLEIVPEGVWE